MTSVHNTSDVPEECMTANAFSFHIMYRISQIYQFIVLVLAVFPLTYFIFFKLGTSKFHGNLKWVLIGYFGSILVFTLAFSVMGFIHVLLPFISTDPCDLILDEEWFKIGHPLGSFLMTLSTVFPITITIERFVAMKKAKSYENMKVILGPALVFIVISIDFSIIFYIYKDENFGTGTISFMIFPSSVAAQMFGLFFIILLLNILNFLFNLFLFRQNSHLKRKNFTLTTKYQLEEVYLSTKLVISIIFFHAVFFAFYLFTMNLSGLIGKKLIEEPMNLWALNGVLMSLIATYNLVIGILSIRLYNKIRAKKTIAINGKVQMKSTGNAGALNYDNAIFSIWNSASSLSSRKTI